MNKRNTIAIVIIIIAILGIALYLFRQSRYLGSVNVRYTTSIEESKSVGAFIAEYDVLYDKPIVDTLRKYGINNHLDEMICWVEQGLEYKPMFFYYKDIKLDFFRLNYTNPFCNIDPQFVIAISGTQCNGVSLYQKFTSIRLQNYRDTIYCNGFIRRGSINKGYINVGEILFVRKR